MSKGKSRHNPDNPANKRDKHCPEYETMSSIAAQLQRDWLDACLSAGIPAVTTDTAARVMAVLYVFGGEHEEMTLNVKFTQEVKYIQQRFHINGGEVPDETFVSTIKHYVGELILAKEPPAWAESLYRDRYGIKLR